ncbi:uncharacterized protein B0H64DRAFT_471729 [Chaetomium fimeti]|uniref:Uncharacterized protein n=1 Tax=Chaetomium fimeti TaxID=1854472 RepID=A0AAE0LVJ4_9PEZI|nr:hypothetical protein B0H64DRAFT_471729 [Chaetomium fimeti]
MAAPPGLLDIYEDAGSAVVVAMGETDFVSFQQTSMIGTRNLNGCSVAMIVSQHGAICTHIPPQPWVTDDPYAGDANAERMMDGVQTYYNHYQAFFPVASTHVVCALYNGSVGLEDQMRIMIRRFNEMGLATEVHHYDVPVDLTATGQGTVVVVSDRGPSPQVYVQDRLVAEFSGDAHSGQGLMPGQSVAQGTATMQDLSSAQGTSAYGMTQNNATDGIVQDNSPYATGQGFATPSASSWAPSMYGTVQGSTTTLGSNLTAQGSTTTTGTAQESTTTLDSSWVQSMHGAAQGPATTPTDSWVRVDVEVKKHTFRSDEFIFYIQNRAVPTGQGSWSEVSLQGGGTVWTYRGRRTGTTYYTYQNIRNL